VTLFPGQLAVRKYPKAQNDRVVQIALLLQAAKIHYTMSEYREDAVSILATVPGERWEIDILEDGEVDFERFVTAGGVTGEAELKAFIKKFAEPVAEERG
jgi:hypothetical protein